MLTGHLISLVSDGLLLSAGLAGLRRAVGVAMPVHRVGNAQLRSSLVGYLKLGEAITDKALETSRVFRAQYKGKPLGDTVQSTWHTVRASGWNVPEGAVAALSQTPKA